MLTGIHHRICYADRSRHRLAGVRHVGGRRELEARRHDGTGRREHPSTAIADRQVALVNYQMRTTLLPTATAPKSGNVARVMLSDTSVMYAL